MTPTAPSIKISLWTKHWSLLTPMQLLFVLRLLPQGCYKIWLYNILIECLLVQFLICNLAIILEMDNALLSKVLIYIQRGNKWLYTIHVIKLNYLIFIGGIKTSCHDQEKDDIEPNVRLDPRKLCVLPDRGPMLAGESFYIYLAFSSFRRYKILCWYVC